MSYGIQGSPFSPNFSIAHIQFFFQHHIIYDLQEKFVQIYLPDWQFYLSKGHWAMGYVAPWHMYYDYLEEKLPLEKAKTVSMKCGSTKYLVELKFYI